MLSVIEPVVAVKDVAGPKEGVWVWEVVVEGFVAAVAGSTGETSRVMVGGGPRLKSVNDSGLMSELKKDFRSCGEKLLMLGAGLMVGELAVLGSASLVTPAAKPTINCGNTNSNKNKINLMLHIIHNLQ